MPAYYPGADTIESATRVILAAGEKREFVDIRTRNAPSRCLEGSVRPRDGGGAVRFEIQEAEPVVRFALRGSQCDRPLKLRARVLRSLQRRKSHAQCTMTGWIVRL